MIRDCLLAGDSFSRLSISACSFFILVRLTGLFLGHISLVFGFGLLALGLAFLFFQPLLLLLLFLKDEVVSLQMVYPGFRLLLTSLHVQCISHHVLHCRHIIGIEDKPYMFGFITDILSEGLSEVRARLSLVGVFMLLSLLLSVLWQTLRAARTNPAMELKKE